MIGLINTLTLHNYLLESRTVKLLENQNCIRNQKPKLKLEKLQGGVMNQFDIYNFR